MAQVQFYKVSSLPGTLQPNAFYYVLNGGYAESYITDQTGTAKALGNSAMINALVGDAVDEAVATINALEIVPDIAARDALAASLQRNVLVLVIDATGDPSVAAGSALYAYDHAEDAFSKVAEYESMDVVVQWTSITGRPTSSPAQIDTAVSQSHTHANKATLDLLGAGADGLTYDGEPVSSSWSTLNW